MSKGKIASQCAHAILDVYRFISDNKLSYSGWESNGEKIVVLKATKSEMNFICSEYSEKIKESPLNFFPIYDAGRTEVEPNSLTVIASTPITDDKKPEWLSKLKLL